MTTDLRCAHVIVTGATGYIGRRVVELALSQGRRVTILGRRSGPAGTRSLRWSLGDPLPDEALDPDFPAERQALAHLAHDWATTGDGNLRGAERLFAGARALGLGPGVFVSSQSARREALNRYGRAKWAIEQALPEAASLRVGLVYGGPAMAMYGLLRRIVRLPVLPMVDPHRRVQPIHRDEVAEGILAAAELGRPGVYALAGPAPIPFGDVLRLMAEKCEGRRLLVLPVPMRLALLGCDLTARLPLIPTVDRERVLGLCGTEPIESAADLRTLGVTAEPMAARLAREPAGRRALLGEARDLLRYAAGRAPAAVLMRRYARAWPEGAMARPRFLLGWREPVGGAGAFARRLRAAARIAETGPRVQEDWARETRGGRLARLCLALAAEGAKFPVRLLFGRRGGGS